MGDGAITYENPEQLDLELPPVDGPSCWRLGASAWVDLEYPHYGRVLVAQAYELCPEAPRPPRRRHRAAKRVTPWAGTAADISALDRASGGATLRDTATRDNLRRINGRTGNTRASELAKQWILNALQDPATHTYGDRKIVSTTLYPPSRPDGPLQIEVECKCGYRQYLPARPFALKQSTIGRRCTDCSRREARRMGQAMCAVGPKAPTRAVG